jgi:hypothetical protein
MYSSVTKSYVDQAISAMGGGEGNGGSSELVVVILEANQKLYGGDGTEFIVRSGKPLTSVVMVSLILQVRRI